MHITDKTIQVIAGDNGILRAMYYQDVSMKAVFATYPELLFIDTAYKLSNLRMPVFIQLIIDGNGESENVSVFVVSTTF